MATEEFNKTPAKANRWFKAFVIFAMLYGITFSLASIFNWLFFFAAVYSLFMSYFLLPQQPKVFQGRSGQSRPFSGGSRPGAPGYTASDTSENTGQQQQQKKANLAVFAGIAALIFAFVLIGMFSAIFSDDDAATTTEIDNAVESPATFVDKGNEFYNATNYDSADWYYDKALEENPNDLGGIYGKGIVLWSKQRTDEAYAYLLKAHEQGFEGAWLSWALADMYDKRGQSSRAVEFYKESVSMDSVCTDCYKRLAALEPANSSVYLQLAEKFK